MSQFSLDVNVGSWNEEKYHIKGLAHVCEHMLFYGSRIYPEMGYFSDFLAKVGG